MSAEKLLRELRLAENNLHVLRQEIQHRQDDAAFVSAVENLWNAHHDGLAEIDDFVAKMIKTWVTTYPASTSEAGQNCPASRYG